MMKLALCENVQIRIFFWPEFYCIWTEYGDLWGRSLYSVRIQENTELKKHEKLVNMKKCNMILTEKQQKYQLYHHVKLMNMNILHVKNIAF